MRVRGDALFPPTIAGRLSILCSILRQLSLVLSTSLVSSELKQLDPDVIIVDQLSACIPFFRLLHPKAKVLFYGHYPDRLLVQREHGVREYVKRLYRIPFDALEGWSTSCADAIVVNSKFTRSVFKRTFPSMRQRELKVIYPCVDTKEPDTAPKDSSIWPGKTILLSINRFERKKNLELAIKAYAGLSKDEQSKARLVVAGGFDPRNPENSVSHKQLQELCDSQDLKHTTSKGTDTALGDIPTDSDVIFLLSISQDLKARLLGAASLLIYTPTNEHFGIVPLEAMLFGVPVLATNTGGPLETIYEGRTGWLRSPDKVAQWTEVMRKPLIPSSASALKAMGQKGRDRVLAEFSKDQMAQTLDVEIRKLVRDLAARPTVLSRWLVVAATVALVAILVGIATIIY